MTKPDTFYCACRHCGERRTVTTGFRARDPHGEKDLFAENDCACPKPAAVFVQVVCEHCGEAGKHWLGCAHIGLPEMPPDHPAFGGKPGTVH